MTTKTVLVIDDSIMIRKMVASMAKTVPKNLVRDPMGQPLCENKDTVVAGALAPP